MFGGQKNLTDLNLAVQIEKIEKIQKAVSISFSSQDKVVSF